MMLSLILAWTAALPPQEGAATVQRPSYAFLRWMEDWSVLAHGAPADEDPFDPIKYVPIDDDGDLWVSFGGRTRLRVEGWNDFNWGAPPGADQDDVFASWRAFVHADVHVGQRFRAFVEAKSALATERDLVGGTRTIDEDELDLQQAFLDVRFGGGDDALVTVRPGRQELLFGKQRLVSPLPWGNTLRTWDGLRVDVAKGDWKASAFATQFVPVDVHTFNDRDEDEQFSGVYATGALSGGLGLDLYWLGLQRRGAAFNGTAGKEDRHTFGSRAFGQRGPVDYDVEVAYQLGDVGDGDVSAYMAAAQVGRRIGEARAYVGFDYASGDDDAGGDVETFNPLYPLGHAFFGQIDAIGRQNVLDASAGASFDAGRGIDVVVEGHAFWAADSDDAIYNAGGGVARPGGSYDDEQIGYEIDLRASKRLSRHLTAEAGYGHFFAGDAIEQSGPDDDIDFAYVSFEYTF